MAALRTVALQHPARGLRTVVGGTEPGGVGSGHLRAIWTSGFRSLVCFSSHKMRRVDKRTASRSWVPGPVAAPTSGDLSEMLLLRRHWRPAASDTRGGPGPLCRRSPQGFPVLLTCEIHWTGRSPPTWWLVRRLSICLWNTATHRSLHRNLRMSSSSLKVSVSRGSLGGRRVDSLERL